MSLYVRRRCTPCRWRIAKSGLLAGLALALLLGCGKKPAPTPSGDGDTAVAKPGGEPKPPAKGDVPAAEARLAEVEKAITAKQKELAQLLEEADTLRRSIAAVRKPKGNVFRTADGLFDDVPKDAYPKAGSGGGAEREDFRKWLKEKFVPGQVLEWEARVLEVKDAGAGPYTVAVELQLPLANTAESAQSMALGKPVSLGGQPCQVVAYTESAPGKFWGCMSVTYANCTRDELNVLRKLEKKTVVLSGKVAPFAARNTLVERPAASLVEDVRDYGAQFPELKVREGQLGIVLAVPVISIDGFLPAASKAEKK